MIRFAILPLALSAVPALAQPAPPPAGGPSAGMRPTIVAEPVALLLAGFDADQDGLVTRTEMLAGAARSFASVARGAADIGYIGYGDWALKWLGDANALPSPFEADSDHNDRITAAEIAGALTRAFNRFDVNKDGTLTRAELVTLRATGFGDGPQQRPGGRGMPQGGQPNGQGRPPRG